ncbi:MAG: PAS domain S-box protein [Sphingobacteriales bacterium]|nr:MAG: PAS domain S-box protein [Sphingobacteriales bacterium]
MSADWRVMHQLDGRGFLPDTHEPTTDWQSKNIHPEDMEKVSAAINESINEKKTFQLEHRVRRIDGTPGWTFSRAVPIFDSNGEIIEWFGTASDITDRKQAENALLETRKRSDQQKRIYEAITSNTPDLMYVFDLDYRFTYANSALLTMWGKTWDTAVGKGLLENGYEPWHAEMHEREIDQVKATKQSVRGEVSFPHATLGRRVYDYILTPVLNEQGEVEAVAGTTRDITERKQWEQSLAQSSEELQAINEEISAINEEQAASNEELSATNDELALVNQKLLAAQQKIEESRVALRLAINAANFGTWFIHSATREFITDARLKELFGYYPDEDLSIEQALAQIPEEHRDFVAIKLENAIYHNGDYDVTYPVIGLHDNRLRWLRAIGNLKADSSGAFSAFTGVVMDITEQYLAANEVKRAEESLRMAIDAAGLGTYYINAADRIFVASPKLKGFFGFRPDEEVPYDAAINQIHPDYRQQAADMVEAAFTKGTRFDLEYPIIGHHDGKIRWVRGIGEIQHYEGKELFTGILHEITEKKLDELRKNDFIGMVSHELKTPLTSLNAIIQVANAKLKTSEDQFLTGAMTKANTQVKRMTTMINGFLNISRLESGKILIEKSRFDIETLVKEVADEMKLTVTTHTLKLDLCYPIVVFADRDKINSVISNLINNAVKYSPNDTTVYINCEGKGNEAIVSVKDAGLGIHPSDAKRIFDRYYRVESSKGSSVVSTIGEYVYIASSRFSGSEPSILGKQHRLGIVNHADTFLHGYQYFFMS